MVRRRGLLVRGILPVALAASLLPHAGVAAVAQPPTTVAGLLARYHDLSHEAEKVNEEFLRIQEDVGRKREASAAAVSRANSAKAAAESARRRASTAREDMDKITAMLSGQQGRQGLSALVGGASRDDVLSSVEAAALAGQVSGRVVEVGGSAIADADRAAAEAATAETAARTAETEVAAGAATVEQRKGELERQITEVQSALNRLTPEQRSLLSSNEFSRSDVKIPAGNVGAILQFVLSQIGKPYIWGAVGPASYDCSGLVQTSYRVGGIAMPRVSIDQSGVGQQVLRHDVRPGDLIFYYNPVHHVAIAVDNLRAVHAPSFGQTVKLASIDAIGPITVIRRVMR
jgi:cell wall-associated NlpC family hydrolase